jgi:hypothetical protein
MGIDGKNASGDVSITFCPNLSICCGNQNTTCCRDGHGVWIQDGQIISTAPSPSYTFTQSALGSNTALSPAVASMTPPMSTPISTPTSGLTQGGKIGLGVGLPIGILVVSLLVYGYVRERRHRQRLETQAYSQDGENSRSGVIAIPPPYELPSGRSVV